MNHDNFPDYMCKICGSIDPPTSENKCPHCGAERGGDED